MTYGYCPRCGAPTKDRERRPNGYDTCENNHKYLSKDARSIPCRIFELYLLWVGNGPFLDVGKELIGAFPSRESALDHLDILKRLERYQHSYHSIEKVDYFS